MTALLLLALHWQDGLDKAITLEQGDLLLPVVAKFIGQECGIDCVVPKSCLNFKLSVFAKNVKARSLLERIGSALDLSGGMEGGKYVFLPGEALREKVLLKYMDAENELRYSRLYARLTSLAALTTSAGGTGSKSSDSPEAWAAAHISKPGYYAMGLAFRYGYLEPSNAGRRPRHAFISPSYILSNHTNPFLVDDPTPRTAVQFTKDIDEGSKSLRGLMIAFGYYPTTGELRVWGGSGADDTPVETPFLYAKPPKELAKTEFAKILSAWETPIDQIPSEIAGLKIRSDSEDELDTPRVSEYFDGRFSLTTELERVHRKSGIAIVASSFRTPALEQKQIEAGTVGQWLSQFQKNEKCFVRTEDGFLLIRHPAYWLLRYSEPPETVIAELEARARKRPLNVGEYADLAYSIGQRPDFGADGTHTDVPHAYDRLVKMRGLLLRFDGEPIEKAYPPLYVLGTMTNEGRQRMVSGQLWDQVQLQGGSSNGRRYGSAPHEIAECGPLFDATMTDRYMTHGERGDNVGIMGMDDLERSAKVAGAPFFAPGSFDRLMRARYFWMDAAGAPTYRFFAGFTNEVTAEYTMTIHASR